MGYYNVRALKKVSHDGRDRIPGDALTQDFVVDDATKTSLVNQGIVSVLSVATSAPSNIRPLVGLMAKYAGTSMIGLQDNYGNDVAVFAPSNGAPSRGNFIVMGTVGDSRDASQFEDPNFFVEKSNYWLAVLSNMLGRTISIAYSGGVSGQRTDQFDIAPDYRVTTALATPGLTDLKLRGCINNITYSVPNGYTDQRTGQVVQLAGSGAAAATDLIGYAERARALGIRVWIEEEEGSDATWANSTWSVAMSQQAAIFNRMMREYAESRPDVILLPWTQVVTDKSSAVNKHLFGVKFDMTHDAPPGAYMKADWCMSNLHLPRRVLPVSGPLDAYSGDPTNPVQLLDNMGFRQTGTGTLGAGSITAASIAWAAGNVGANTVWSSGGNLYLAQNAGTATAGNAPVHTTGSVKTADGINWLYLCGGINSVPATWTVAAQATGSYIMGTVANPDGSNDVVIVAYFAAANDSVSLTSASNPARFLTTLKYSVEVARTIIAQSNLGTVYSQYDRGDYSNPPRAGFCTSAYWSDNNTGGPHVVMNAVTFARTETLVTKPIAGNPATWQGARMYVKGAGAGFAIVRFSPVAIKPRTNSYV